MTDKHKLYNGLSQAAWGCVFLYLNVNIGPVNLLPEFAAFLLFLSAIRNLEEEERELTLLKPFCVILCLCYLLYWCGAFVGGLSGEWTTVPQLIADVILLYFSFQFYTNLSQLAEKYQGPEDTLDRKLLRLRTVQVVLTTALFLVTRLLPVRSSWWEIVALGMTMVQAVVCLWIMFTLFAVRRLFRKSPESDME